MKSVHASAVITTVLVVPTLMSRRMMIVLLKTTALLPSKHLPTKFFLSPPIRPMFPTLAILTTSSLWLKPRPLPSPTPTLISPLTKFLLVKQMHTSSTTRAPATTLKHLFTKSILMAESTTLKVKMRKTLSTNYRKNMLKKMTTMRRLTTRST